jgi:hypothetical protein
MKKLMLALALVVGMAVPSTARALDTGEEPLRALACAGVAIAAGTAVKLSFPEGDWKNQLFTATVALGSGVLLAFVGDMLDDGLRGGHRDRYLVSGSLAAGIGTVTILNIKF